MIWSAGSSHQLISNNTRSLGWEWCVCVFDAGFPLEGKEGGQTLLSWGGDQHTAFMGGGGGGGGGDQHSAFMGGGTNSALMGGGETNTLPSWGGGGGGGGGAVDHIKLVM